jgi:hypothetical protein
MSPRLARRFLATVVAAVGLLAKPSECARAFFVFGDSLVDSGNNNFLMTSARAAVRGRLPDAPGNRPLLQRQEHPRHHQYVFLGRCAPYIAAREFFLDTYIYRYAADG